MNLEVCKGLDVQGSALSQKGCNIVLPIALAGSIARQHISAAKR